MLSFNSQPRVPGPFREPLLQDLNYAANFLEDFSSLMGVTPPDKELFKELLSHAFRRPSVTSIFEFYQDPGESFQDRRKRFGDILEKYDSLSRLLVDPLLSDFVANAKDTLFSTFYEGRPYDGAIFQHQGRAIRYQKGWLHIHNAELEKLNSEIHLYRMFGREFLNENIERLGEVYSRDSGNAEHFVSLAHGVIGHCLEKSTGDAGKSKTFNGLLSAALKSKEVLKKLEDIYKYSPDVFGALFPRDRDIFSGSYSPSRFETLIEGLNEVEKFVTEQSKDNKEMLAKYLRKSRSINLTVEDNVRLVSTLNAKPFFFDLCRELEKHRIPKDFIRPNGINFLRHRAYNVVSLDDGGHRHLIDFIYSFKAREDYKEIIRFFFSVEIEPFLHNTHFDSFCRKLGETVYSDEAFSKALYAIKMGEYDKVESSLTSQEERVKTQEPVRENQLDPNDYLGITVRFVEERKLSNSDPKRELIIRAGKELGQHIRSKLTDVLKEFVALNEEPLRGVVENLPSLIEKKAFKILIGDVSLTRRWIKLIRCPLTWEAALEGLVNLPDDKINNKRTKCLVTEYLSYFEKLKSGEDQKEPKHNVPAEEREGRHKNEFGFSRIIIIGGQWMENNVKMFQKHFPPDVQVKYIGLEQFKTPGHLPPMGDGDLVVLLTGSLSHSLSGRVRQRSAAPCLICSFANPDMVAGFVLERSPNVKRER